MKQSAEDDDDAGLDNEKRDGTLGVIVSRILAFQDAALWSRSECRSC